MNIALLRLVQESRLFETQAHPGDDLQYQNASELKSRLARWPGCEAVMVALNTSQDTRSFKKPLP
ncbi:MAG: hypothetical protein U0175_29805 [Caldilineaceae bacterium]